MIEGRVHRFGDNIDTDAIVPVHSATLVDPVELGKHCMENIDPDFIHRVQPGDIIVASRNFGCGSSREIAPWSIKGAGISCVIAETFARIFFRNAINIALPVMICPEAAAVTEDGDRLEVDVSSGTIRNLTKEKRFQAAPYPEFVQELIACGGLVEFTRKRLTQNRMGK
ncbi:MAG: 3-isopropylmalate dehydratase small subunit [Desulfobacteraceae bacterium]|nr:MAG: 3-isopropylmalate dehydratase small subunit [Desulfobacteraceae bacterium]